ncbi:TetR/AcrR family transcriptional regulator [Actinoplanes subtropicus]|uniref:TetR/AcrR family transcriptional regulator n=1 Tax=Actinoplanes subtropicus TaxID=543632 RepID=UPI0004C453B1|nr:TetR family transcriptional regulator [Actinoplanes subtropicus]
MTSEPGLRERKKAATRAALSRTAWSMMLEQGLDAVTPESVAAAADMAPRTFRYHFRNREEAILDELAQQQLTLAARLRARPAGEPIWDGLLRVLPQAVTEIAGNRTEFATLMRAIVANPTLLAENLLVLDRSRVSLAEVIAERTGTDPRTDTYANLLAGAAITAISTSITHWARPTTDAALADLIHDSLTRLQAGLPAPDPSPSRPPE